MKRICDLFFSFLGVVLLAPLFLVVALAIKFDGRGSIFFLQERVGRKGKLFKIWKFRTMKVSSSGPSITVGNDQRVTRVGRVLRKYKVDELPQLINVLKGEMSLVGPRPEVARYVQYYTEDQREVLEYRPGITDPASLKYFNESELLAQHEDPESYYINEVIPDKIKINLEYHRTAHWFSDLGVIYRTLASSLST